MSPQGRIHGITTLVLGAALSGFAVYMMVAAGNVVTGFIPLAIGLALVYLGWRGGRTATIVFGHVTIVVGCFLVTWGISLPPVPQPAAVDIFGRPLFWGLISIFGGICAIYHGFCHCCGGIPHDRAGGPAAG